MPVEPTFETLRLWSADAIVLHEWLNSLNFDTLPVSHPAEKQALTDLLTCLQMYTSAEYATQAEVDAAREQVAKDMGG